LIAGIVMSSFDPALRLSVSAVSIKERKEREVDGHEE
jgi:hypothetical protein